MKGDRGRRGVNGGGGGTRGGRSDITFGHYYMYESDRLGVALEAQLRILQLPEGFESRRYQLNKFSV